MTATSSPTVDCPLPTEGAAPVILGWLISEDGERMAVFIADEGKLWQVVGNRKLLGDWN